MAQSIDIKRNDRGIGVEATLSNSQGAIDLTGATVLFLYEGNEIQAQIQDAPNGIVVVPFERRNTQDAGVYSAEFEIEHADGSVETAPSNGYLTLNIHRDLGGRLV